MSTKNLYQTNATHSTAIEGGDNSFAGETGELNDLQTINVEPPQITFFDWLDGKLPKKKSKGFFEWLDGML